MKIIDILNKIANDEEVPKKIKYDGEIFKWQNDWYFYDTDTLILEKMQIDVINLNDEVEILEEEPRDIEVCGSLFTKSEYDKLAHCEEDKKINKIRIDYNSVNIDKAFETGTTTFFREKDIEIFQCLSAKINELIDEVNKLKESDK